VSVRMSVSVLVCVATPVASRIEFHDVISVNDISAMHYAQV